MSPKAGDMLLMSVRPIIHAVIGKGLVKTFGTEDGEELEADAVAQAAAIIESAEREGKELAPNSVAYYALRNLQAGRRWGCSAGDVMSPALHLSGRLKGLESLDAPLGNGDDADDEFTLLDCLATAGEDPASASARELDWNQATEALENRELEILGITAAGFQGTEIAKKFAISTPRITQIKRNIGQKLRYALGADVLATCVCETAWQGGIRAYQEKKACRHEVKQAQKVPVSGRGRSKAPTR
jgi:DNA-binding CsgD family transcriptional regulator